MTRPVRGDRGWAPTSLAAPLLLATAAVRAAPVVGRLLAASLHRTAIAVVVLQLQKLPLQAVVVHAQRHRIAQHSSASVAAHHLLLRDQHQHERQPGLRKPRAYWRH